MWRVDQFHGINWPNLDTDLITNFVDVVQMWYEAERRRPAPRSWAAFSRAAHRAAHTDV